MTERRKIAAERRRNIAVGMTALAGLIGLVILLAAFGYVPKLLQKNYDITVYMENVAGLSPDSLVTLWGRDVGEVVEVGFAEAGAPERAYVRLSIRDEFSVPADVTVRIETPLFGGGPMVALVGGNSAASPLAKDGSAVLATSRIVDPLMQLEVVSEDLAELKATWVGVGENINALFGTQGEGQPSLPRVVLGLEQRLAELQRVMAGAEAWLGNDQLREDVTQTAANARELSDSLGKTVAGLEARYLALADAAEARLATVDEALSGATKTFDAAGQSVAEIETRFVALADDASHVINVIDRLVARADSKDSTIGLLLSDPQLYQNLADTSERLKLMIGEARLLVEKWQAEGVPLRLFK